MKKLIPSLIIFLAAAMCCTAMSGCGIIRSFFYQPTPATTVPVETTFEQATEAQTTEEAATAESPSSSGSASQGKYLDGAILVEDDYYYDSYIGITFYIPEWKGKVYAKGEIYDQNYSLAFYEAENYEYGVENNMQGMGMLFTVMTGDEESTGDFIDYPAGSILLGTELKYLTYFKPTDVRFNSDDDSMTESYQNLYQYQREYFLSGVVDEEMIYDPSSNANALNLKSE